MKIQRFLVAVVLGGALMVAGCSGGSSSSQKVDQLAGQAQALADQMKVAASVDAVKAQQTALATLADKLAGLKAEVATLPSGANLDTQITVVASLISTVQRQLDVELEALKAGSTTAFRSYTTAIGTISVSVKNIAAEIAAGAAVSSLPAVQQVEASQLATVQVLLTALQKAVDGLPTSLTSTVNPQISITVEQVSSLQQQVMASGTLTADQLASLEGQVNSTIDQVAVFVVTTAAAAGDLASLSAVQQAQVATIQTLAASATILANQNVTPDPQGGTTDNSAALQGQLDAANQTITDLNGTLASLQDQLGSASTTIATQGDTITTQGSTIADLEAAINAANQTIAQLQQSIASLEATVDALQNPPAPPLPINFTVADNGTTSKTVVAKIAPGAASTLYFSLVSATGGRVTATLSSTSQAVDGDGSATVTINEYGAGKTYVLTATTVGSNATTVAKAVTGFVVSDAVAAGSGTVVYQGSVTVSTMAMGWQATVPQANGGPVNVNSTVATATGVYSIVTEGLYPTIYSHLEKRDPTTGNLLWATTATISDVFTRLYVNPAGDVLVTGVVNGNLTMAPQTPYLAKINPTNGDYIWIWNKSIAYDLAFDSNNNNYIADGGRVIAVSSTGSTLWASGYVDGVSQLAVKDATVYQVNTNFGTITVIARSAVSGVPLWSKTVISGDISTINHNSRAVVATDALYIVDNAISYNGGPTYMRVQKVAFDGTLIGSTYDFNTINPDDARLVVSGGNIYASYAASPISFNIIKLTASGYSWVATYPTPIGQSLQVGIVGTQLYSGGGTFVTRFNDLPIN